MDTVCLSVKHDPLLQYKLGELVKGRNIIHGHIVWSHFISFAYAYPSEPYTDRDGSFDRTFFGILFDFISFVFSFLFFTYSQKQQKKKKEGKFAFGSYDD